VDDHVRALGGARQLVRVEEARAPRLAAVRAGGLFTPLVACRACDRVPAMKILKGPPSVRRVDAYRPEGRQVLKLKTR
jgi:hypothetical protein